MNAVNMILNIKRLLENINNLPTKGNLLCNKL